MANVTLGSVVRDYPLTDDERLTALTALQCATPASSGYLRWQYGDDNECLGCDLLAAESSSSGAPSVTSWLCWINTQQRRVNGRPSKVRSPDDQDSAR